MTKNVTVMSLILLMSFPIWAAGLCSKHLKSVKDLIQNDQTYNDPDLRFSLQGPTQQSISLNKKTLNLADVSKTESFMDVRSEYPQVNSVLQSLGAKGKFHSLADSQIFAYLKSQAKTPEKKGLQTSFVFWEGHGRHIEKHSLVQGEVLSVTKKLAQNRSKNTVESFNHYNIKLLDKNNNVIHLKIPEFLNQVEFKTLRPPQKNTRGEFSGYHWGLLLGYSS